METKDLANIIKDTIDAVTDRDPQSPLNKGEGK